MEVTVETEQLLIIRRRKSDGTLCAKCGTEVDCRVVVGAEAEGAAPKFVDLVPNPGTCNVKDGVQAPVLRGLALLAHRIRTVRRFLISS